MTSFGRLRLVMLAAVGLAVGSVYAWSYAETPEEQAVLAPIHAMFDGMAKRDAAAIKAPTLAVA